jgi:flagellar hook-associated protein 2
MAVYSTSGATSSTLDQYISQIMAIEHRSVDTLESKKRNLELKRSVFTDLSAKLSSLRTLARELKNVGSLSPFRTFGVDSSDETLVSATATAYAQQATHTVNVTGLAQAHVIASAGYVATDTDFSEGTYTFQLTVGSTTSDVNVDIAAGDNNETVLQAVADAINGSGAEVAATLVTTDTVTDTKKLVVTSKETGTANLIANVVDTSGSLAAALQINGASAVGSWSAATTQQADDAAFTLDGISIISSTNIVEDVLSGVTLNLKNVTGGNVTLTIEPDSTAIRAKVEGFIEKYNDVIGYLNEKTAISEDGQARGDLAGYVSFTQLFYGLRGYVSAAVTTVESGNPGRLTDVGLSVNSDGTLSISNSETLADTINAGIEKLEDLFNTTDGVAYKLDAKLTDYLEAGGIIDLERNLVADQIDDLDDQIDDLEQRLSYREQELRKKFANLQVFASRLAEQQTVLQSLLSGSLF